MNCPKCGTKLALVSITCGKTPGRSYRCSAYRCDWEYNSTHTHHGPYPYIPSEVEMLTPEEHEAAHRLDPRP